MKLKRKTKVRNLYQLECSSVSKNVSCIEGFLEDIRNKHNIDDGTMYRLLVSCTEAVNNAIIHGNKSDPTKKVNVICKVEKKNLTIRVRDLGIGFNSENLPDPRDEKNLLKESGRGIFLMRSLMDEVRFKKLKSGSVVVMKLKLH